METFENIAEKPDFRKLYTTAIELAGIWDRIETLDLEGSLNKTLKVLDLGGGTGTLGSMLAGKCDPIVEYVNVDTVESALQLSTGRKVHGSYTNLSDLLGGEKFDYVFALNIYTPHSKTCSHILKQIAKRAQDASRIMENIKKLAYIMDLLYERMVLLNAALSVTDDGKFVTGGVIPRALCEAIASTLEDYGMQSSSHALVNLGIDSARQFARLDLQDIGENPSPNDFEGIALAYLQNFRIAVFDKTRSIKDARIIDRIKQTSEQYSQLSSYISAQAQFWG
jgi:hypothetical protein